MFIIRVFVAGHHGLEVRRAGVAQRAEIDVDQDVEHEGDEDQHVHRVDHANATEEIDLRGETFHVPQQDAGIDLNREQQHHDDLVDHALQRVEFAVDGRRERIGIAAENAEGVEIGLPVAADEMLLEVQLGVIGPDAVGRDVERQPQKEIGDQYEADEVVGADGGVERHDVDQPDITNLHSRQDHQDETQRIGPVPNADRQRVDVESHDAVPFPCLLYTSPSPR